MNAYFWTALADYGGPLLLLPVWGVLAWRAWRGGHRLGALVLAGACGAMGTWFVDGMLPLVRGWDATGVEYPLARAASVPWVAIAVLAGLRGAPDTSRRLDLVSLSALTLIARGFAGWMAALMLTARHWMAPGSPRAVLVAGLLALGIATGLEGQRFAAFGWAGGTLGTSLDNSVRVVHATITALEVGGATALVLPLLGASSTSRSRRGIASPIG